MTKVGWLGLGRLGLPCALTLAAHGHQVVGYDVGDLPGKILAGGHPPPREEGIEALLADTTLHLASSLSDLVYASDVVFVAVQTPHAPEYGGDRQMPEERRDFEYAFLAQAVRDVAECARGLRRSITVVVVSTALPGTFNCRLRALANPFVKLVYNPFFIAMGTTISDLLDPEFVLIGVDDRDDAKDLCAIYGTLHDKPMFVTSIESAELIKVSYNTFISMKIVFANMLMEIAHKTGADCDQVIDALSLATDRVVSPAYLRGGMGDGGACLPPGQLVMTERGPRAIETIRVGDRVLSGDGTLQRVVRTWERNYDGDLVTLRAEGMPCIKLTSDHRVFVAADGRPAKSGRNHYPVLGKTVADLLKPYCEVVSAEVVVGTDHMSWPHVVEDFSVLAPSYVTPDYVELAGWYLSEGHIDTVFSAQGNLRSARVGFSLHADEVRERERICELLLAVAPPRQTGRGSGASAADPRVWIKDNRAGVRYGSVSLATRLEADFGHGCATKTLPPWLLWGDEKWARLVLLGLFGGDGHADEAGLSFTTTSIDLAYGVLVLLDRLGIPSTLTALSRSGKLPSFDVKVRNSLHILQLSEIVQMECPVVRKGYIRFPDRGDGRLYRRVTSMSVESYSGPVHNLWVEGSHTYVTSAGTVSNCHPRDLIAMSWLAERLDLSVDLMGFMASAREAQTEWLATLVGQWAELTGLPIVLLGVAYKPDSDLTDGSPALLLQDMLAGEYLVTNHVDPIVDGNLDVHFDHRSLFVVTTRHSVWEDFDFPMGSVVIDPFGYVQDTEGVVVVRIGRKS